MVKIKRFRTRNGSTARLVLPSGHTAIVGMEWRDLPEQFWSDAYSKGCVSDDQEVSREVKEAAESGALDALKEKADIKSKIRGAIEKALDENILNAFTKNGNPSAKYLRDELGETVPNHLKDEVWNSMLEQGTTAPELKDPVSNDIT